MASRPHPRKLGQQGEALAERTLIELGFTVLGRNVRLKAVEFDLIVRRADELWFVEVKTRRNTIGGFPYEAIDDAKLARMESGALEFLESRGIDDVDYRFMAASIVERSGPGELQIEWVPLL